MSSNKESTLSRLLSILNCVSESHHRLSTKDLAKELNLPKPTVYRLVNQLIDNGLLKRDHNDNGFVAGDNLQKLSMQVLSNETINAPRRAILQKLSQEVGETCNLTHLDGNVVVYFDRVETHWPMRIQLPIGSRVPLHCTASGKLFLANMSERKRSTMIDNLILESYTENTIVNKDALLKEVLQTKKTGIGIDRQEFIQGMVAISVPVFNKNNDMIFTVAIHAPSIRVSIEELHQYIPLLHQTTEIVNELYSGSSDF